MDASRPQGMVIACSQVVPPFVDLRMILFSPVAYPVKGSGKCTEKRVLEVPEDWLVQDIPASLDFRIVPESPTIKPFSESGKDTEFRFIDVPETT